MLNFHYSTRAYTARVLQIWRFSSNFIFLILLDSPLKGERRGWISSGSNLECIPKNVDVSNSLTLPLRWDRDTTICLRITHFLESGPNIFNSRPEFGII